MDDEADVRKMIEVLEKSKKETLDDFHYEEFIDYEDSDVEEVCFDEDITNELEDLESLDSFSTIDLSSIYKYNPVCSLKSEERVVIDSCIDPELKQLLLLNREKTIQLIQLYKKVKDLLIECKQNIVEKNEIIKECIESSKGGTCSIGSWRLGAPYFKDRQLYCCPSNDDTLRKRSNQELSFYDLLPIPKWTSQECDRLLRAVKFHYNLNQQKEVRRKIKETSLNSDSANKKDELEELEALLEKLEENVNTEVPPLHSDENIDWFRVVEVFIGDKHTEFECRSCWHIFLHPSINKSPWTAAENEKLRELAKKYNCQQWDKIAQELGTNRSCLTTCINYFSNVHKKYKRGEFTFAEDRKLLELISKYKMGSYIPWVKIVRHFKYRNRTQLHHRYTYYLSQNDRKTGKFSQAEDIIIMICVDRFGKNYKKCSEYLIDRSVAQVKSRYNSNLENFIKKGTWTVEEDKMIMDHVSKHGPMFWADLGKEMYRSRSQLRQRYQVVSSFLRDNPDASIEGVTRRKHNWYKEEQDYIKLRKIADQYKNETFIPTVRDIEKYLKTLKFNTCLEPGDQVTEHIGNDDVVSDLDTSDSKNIDDMLTDFFSNSFKVEVDSELTPKLMKGAVDDMELLLDILKVDLDIPDKLEANSRLDNIDIEILKALPQSRVSSSRSFCNRTKQIKELVPPNLHSIVGLRSLLIKNLHFKHSSNQKIFDNLKLKPQSTVSRIKFTIMQYLSELEPAQKAIVDADRALFFKRFYSLFKWPALMTLEGPSAELKHTTENIEEDTRPLLKRTYSRMNKAQNSNDNSTIKEKKMKVADTHQPLKLTPVTDKSVIENLLRDKSKKLFYFNEVKCGKETKTVIKEVKFNFITRQTIAQHSLTSSGQDTNEPDATTGEASSNSQSENGFEMDLSSKDNINRTDDCRTVPTSSKQQDHLETDASRKRKADDVEDCGISEESSSASIMESIAEDMLMLRQSKLRTECDDGGDLYDLQKLNIFLKREQEENDSDSASDISSIL